MNYDEKRQTMSNYTTDLNSTYQTTIIQTVKWKNQHNRKIQTCDGNDWTVVTGGCFDRVV